MTTRSKLIGASAIVAATLLATSACGKDDDKKSNESAGAKVTSGTDKGSDTKDTDTKGTGTDTKSTDTAAPTKPAGLELVTLSKPPTAEETTAATELAKKLLDPAQATAAARDNANARAFVILAATHKDPKVVGAALGGMFKAFKRGAAEADADFNAVVASRLGATDNEVLRGALRAADHVVHGKEVDANVRKALIAVISNSAIPAGQHQGIKLLRGYPAVGRDAAIVAALIGRFDSDANYVAASAIVALSAAMPKPIPDEAALQTKIEGLMKHANPGVRGEAAELLANFVSYGDEEKGEEIGKLFVPMLKDDDPFVKSQAASALASVKYKGGIHAIIPLLDDSTRNTYDIEGWKNLWGTAGRDHHDGSGWSRVDDAALFALTVMTTRDHEKHQFKYKINRGTVDEDIAKSVVAAKKWYEAHKSTLPPAP